MGIAKNKKKGETDPGLSNFEIFRSLISMANKEIYKCIYRYKEYTFRLKYHPA